MIKEDLLFLLRLLHHLPLFLLPLFLSSPRQKDLGLGFSALGLSTTSTLCRNLQRGPLLLHSAYGNGLESKKTALCSSDAMEFHAKPHPPNLDDVQVDCNWEDVTCPICLDFPHNGVMLQCSSYDKGCRPFMCDTNQAHSNCLERFKSAYGMPIVVKVTSTTHGATVVCIQDISSNSGSRPACPLCRGDVTGWVVIDKARVYLNMKKRCCEEKQCSYIGNFTELQKHAELKHPHSCPSEIDPARQLDWDNFQQSTEIIDVLSTIHAEVPHGVVLGDYVIEYGDAETGDEHEDFPRSRGNWLTSCISCKVFHRGPRSRQRSRRSGRRSSDHSGSDGSNVGENSTRSVDIRGFRFVETDDELPRTGGSNTESIVIPNHYR
ncbi:uncharacterized protein LOC122012431 isoform X2 [Zingiber officinale]|nr:uncharacterized protein LOC122012431 isoform X2 [Zingiber officinale]